MKRWLAMLAILGIYGDVYAAAPVCPSNRAITFRWQAGTGGGPVNSFRLYGAAVSGGPYDPPVDVGLPAPDASGVQLNTVAGISMSGRFFVLGATGPGGDGPMSNEIPLRAAPPCGPLLLDLMLAPDGTVTGTVKTP